MIVGENTLDLQGENWECCVGTKRARKTGRLDLYAVGYYYSSISREREREREGESECVRVSSVCYVEVVTVHSHCFAVRSNSPLPLNFKVIKFTLLIYPVFNIYRKLLNSSNTELYVI